ncbi:MAG: cation:proton antiporter subunit C [Bacteroidales bacterium]|nr:cation:proton antiporter subunit C [Bacteroidales bacterium]
MNFFSVQGISLTIGFILILIGLWGILTQRNLIRIIIGFTIFNNGVNLIIVALAYMKGRTAPIIDQVVTRTDAVDKVADPIPQALVLTAIVIGVGVTAVMLSYTLRMYRAKHSLEINVFTESKW